MRVIGSPITEVLIHGLLHNSENYSFEADCVTFLSVRVRQRLANSILKALSCLGFAPSRAASAAARKLFSLASWPSSACSASLDLHGLVPTPPKAMRTRSMRLPLSKTATAADDSPNSYEARSRSLK